MCEIEPNKSTNRSALTDVSPNRILKHQTRIHPTHTSLYLDDISHQVYCLGTSPCLALGLSACFTESKNTYFKKKWFQEGWSGKNRIGLIGPISSRISPTVKGTISHRFEEKLFFWSCFAISVNRARHGKNTRFFSLVSNDNLVLVRSHLELQLSFIPVKKNNW